jgi:hypothetical protein
MIVSHRHRLIFVRPRKVASSSLEIALAALTGPGDLLTPQTDRDSKGQGEVPEGVRPRFFHGFDRNGLPIFIGGHDPVAKAFRALGTRLDDYLIVTAERNPWDRAVSMFYWSQRRNDMRQRPVDAQVAAFRAYVRQSRNALAWRVTPPFVPQPHRALSQTYLYMLDGVPVVDVILRFERLAEDIDALSQRLGLAVPLEIDGIRAKTGYRDAASRDLDAFYDDETRRIIAQACAWEIAQLGYEYGSDRVSDFTPDPRRNAARLRYARRHGPRSGGA